MPLNVQVSRSRELSFNPTPYTLLVSWDAPDNSEKFDLEYFKVHIMQENRYIANGTSREEEYYFHSQTDVISPQVQSDMHIVVTTVNKCSQQGLRSPTYRLELSEDTVDIKPTFTKDPDAIGKTEKVVRDCRSLTNGKFIAFCTDNVTCSYNYTYLIPKQVTRR